MLFRSPPRPANGDTIYNIHASGSDTNSMSMLACQYTANQSGLVSLTFDLLTLKMVSESRVTWATYVPILVFLWPLCSRLGPDVRDRQMSDFRQHHRLMPRLGGRGHNKASVFNEYAFYNFYYRIGPCY